VLSLEERIYVDTERQLDRLTRGAGGSDDDDTALRVGRVPIGLGIRRKVVIAGGVHGGK
jgi:hypothetical protein